MDHHKGKEMFKAMKSLHDRSRAQEKGRKTGERRLEG